MDTCVKCGEPTAGEGYSFCMEHFQELARGESVWPRQRYNPIPATTEPNGPNPGHYPGETKMNDFHDETCGPCLDASCEDHHPHTGMRGEDGPIQPSYGMYHKPIAGEPGPILPHPVSLKTRIKRQRKLNAKIRREIKRYAILDNLIAEERTLNLNLNLNLEKLASRF